MIEFQADGTAGIALTGEIDILTVEGITGQVDAALAAGPAEIVVHMDAVTFIDSMGLGTLVRSYRACAARGIPFVIADPSPQVRRLLQLTALDQAFTVRVTSETEGEAV
jgi:anti-sigma B factor antagonist